MNIEVLFRKLQIIYEYNIFHFFFVLFTFSMSPLLTLTFVSFLLVPRRLDLSTQRPKFNLTAIFSLSSLFFFLNIRVLVVCFPSLSCVFSEPLGLGMELFRSSFW